MPMIEPGAAGCKARMLSSICAMLPPPPIKFKYYQTAKLVVHKRNAVLLHHIEETHY